MSRRSYSANSSRISGTWPCLQVNTGCREQEVCQLRWEWEIPIPELLTSVFVVPKEKVKNRRDRLVVLNTIAKAVIERERDNHPTHVFTYRGRRGQHL